MSWLVQMATLENFQDVLNEITEGGFIIHSIHPQKIVKAEFPAMGVVEETYVAYTILARTPTPPPEPEPAPAPKFLGGRKREQSNG